MEQKKTNKKKLVIALALLALIVVASVITTVVLVLAAGQQNVQSNVTVTYSVTDVSATVYGKFGQKVESGNAVTNKMSPESITFTADQEQDKNNLPTMSPTTVSLSANSDYAVFEYRFVNNATERPFTIELTYTDDYKSGDASTTKDKNISVGYTSSASALTSFDVYTRKTATTEASWADGWTNTFTKTTCTTSTYVYVVVAVESLDKAANFSGSFAFTLTAVPDAND